MIRNIMGCLIAVGTGNRPPQWMADVLVAFPGASAEDVENLVARPAEQVLSRMHGVEHVYSVSRPGMAIIITSIDNLVRGAAGQAIQNMNVMFGIDEHEGLR
jgi:N-acetyl-gamma-glutamylphosphate reductase